MLLGLIGVERQRARLRDKAVLPYAKELCRFPAYLQQLDMDRTASRSPSTGHRSTHDTGPIVGGEPGTNGQHAFYQLLHQGTRIVRPTSSASPNRTTPHRDHHDLLMANLIAQAEALAFGRPTRRAVPQLPGNRPSTVILADARTPSCSAS